MAVRVVIEFKSRVRVGWERAELLAAAANR
jgi:hypothetical protein